MLGIVAFMAVVFALVIAQLVNLQVARSSYFSGLARRELLTTVTVPSLRGGIFDRNGQILSLSVPSIRLQADDAQIKDPVHEAAALAPLLGMTAPDQVAALTAKLSEHGPGSGQVDLADNISQATATKVLHQLYNLGLATTTQYPRSSPNGALATSILGTLDWQGAGSGGLEYAYNHELAGHPVLTRVFQSPNGLNIPQASPVILRHARPGRGLELTIDLPLQFQTERALAAEILSAHALSGTAIIMDTRTGQILAQANLVNSSLRGATGALSLPPYLPSKNPILPGVQQSMNNLALTQTYEPGSVFKLVTFAGALEAKAIQPTKVFTVPDHFTLDGHLFHDAETHPVLKMTATDILAQSSNVGTSQIARLLGEAGLLAETQNLGFGEYTGIHFPGESAGLTINAQTWSPTDYVSMAIGQVDAVTPQQVLDAYNAVANNGVFVTPSLVRGIVDASGSVTSAPGASSRRVMSAETASTLTAMLRQVVLVGTGTNAVVPGYAVAGKTGTSQIPIPGRSGYLAGDYNATFVGFAPASNPVFSAIVVLSRPTPQYFGGEVAAPVFSTIMSYALHRWGIPRTAGAPTKIVTTKKLTGGVTGGGL